MMHALLGRCDNVHVFLLTARADSCPSVAPISAPACWANSRRSCTNYKPSRRRTWEPVRPARNAACWRAIPFPATKKRLTSSNRSLPCCPSSRACALCLPHRRHAQTPGCVALLFCSFLPSFLFFSFLPFIQQRQAR